MQDRKQRSVRSNSKGVWTWPSKKSNSHCGRARKVILEKEEKNRMN